jgi:enamine deaminase RidA (YjgF/YER057c/UK114 family)
MANRTSITVPGFSHGQQPIPAASRVGPLVATGGVHGVDPATGKLPEALEDEVRSMFSNLARIMAAAGGSLDDVARITVFVRALEHRGAVNAEWIALFPDAESRPARHTLLNEDLAGNMRVQCDALAFISSREES